MDIRKAATATSAVSGIWLTTCRKLASKVVSILTAEFQDSQGKIEALTLQKEIGIRAVPKRIDVSKKAMAEMW